MKAMSWSAVAAAAGVFLTLAGPAAAEEVTVDVTKSRKAVVGTTRVVLLDVTRAVTPLEGKEPAKSIEIRYAVEPLGEGQLGRFVDYKLEVFAAGTTNPGLRLKGELAKGPLNPVSREPYLGYEKRLYYVPATAPVDSKQRAQVVYAAFANAELAAGSVDLKLVVDGHTVWFKGLKFD